MQTAMLCAALLILLLIGLGIAVQISRGFTTTAIGSAEDPTDYLYKLIRTHANCSEYVPALALLFYLVGTRSPGAVEIGLIIGITVARFLHPVGMMMSSTLKKPQIFRFLGAAGTNLLGFVLATLFLLDVMSQ